MPDTDLQEQELIQTNPVVHRQYRRSIKDLAMELERAAATPSESVKRAFVLSCTISLAQLVMESPLPYKASLKTVYASVLRKSLWKLLSNVRRLRSDFSKEIGTLLRKGPERYYQTAIAELAALRPTRN